MNLDDPRVTAFALGELDEPGKSAMAQAIAKSPEAQREVDEILSVAKALRSEFTVDLDSASAISGDFPVVEPSAGQGLGARRSLSDIQSDRWFWTIGRPLGLAATIAVLALVTAIVVSPRRSQVARSPMPPSEIEMTGIVPDGDSAPSAVAGPETVPNPISPEVVSRVASVVVGQPLQGSQGAGKEIKVVEIIRDPFRLEQLKASIATAHLSKRNRRGVPLQAYDLIFLDRSGGILASASFSTAPGLGAVLQPSAHAVQREGRYYIGVGDAALPGAWDSRVDYAGYAIPFQNWPQAI